MSIYCSTRSSADPPRTPLPTARPFQRNYGASWRLRRCCLSCHARTNERTLLEQSGGEQIKACAANGKHVFCEKPIATDVPETIEAINACKAADVKLMTALQRRFDPNFARVKIAIADGEVGEVLQVGVLVVWCLVRLVICSRGSCCSTPIDRSRNKPRCKRGAKRLVGGASKRYRVEALPPKVML